LDWEKQSTREEHLREMLTDFNEGRSKSYYCIAATLLDSVDLEASPVNARERTYGLDKREKSQYLHSLLDAAARTQSIKRALSK